MILPSIFRLDGYYKNQLEDRSHREEKRNNYKTISLLLPLLRNMPCEAGTLEGDMVCEEGECDPVEGSVALEPRVQEATGRQLKHLKLKQNAFIVRRRATGSVIAISEKPTMGRTHHMPHHRSQQVSHSQFSIDVQRRLRAGHG